MLFLFACMTFLKCRLRGISLMIGIHGVDYERGKFQEKLSNGTTSLAKTTVTLKQINYTNDVRN
jgi:hypothetical protein